MSTIFNPTPLNDLHPRLRQVFVLAAGRFNGPTVYIVETLRSEKRQAALVQAGASRTMKSKHLKQADGYSHAIDVAFMIDGDVRFDWPVYYPFAEEMRKAARELELDITWGAIWDTYLNKVIGPLAQQHAAYVARFAAKKGRKPLADGQHFQVG